MLKRKSGFCIGSRSRLDQKAIRELGVELFPRKLYETMSRIGGLSHVDRCGDDEWEGRTMDVRESKGGCACIASNYIASWHCCGPTIKEQF